MKFTVTPNTKKTIAGVGLPLTEPPKQILEAVFTCFKLAVRLAY